MILKYEITKLNKYINVREILRCEFNMSKRLIAKLRLNNKILLNNIVTFPDQKVNLGDVLTCNLDFIEDSTNIVATKIDLNIVYEDESFLILNKPPKIAVHPSMLHYDNSLSNGVKYYYNKIGLSRKIRPVNRLDKDTSGLVIFAKNEYVQEQLINQMKTNTFKKHYLAILSGNLDTISGTINAPISRKNGSIIERCVDLNGAPSITHYKLIKNFDDFCLVDFTLETGRTHQIRVHSKYIGHPILGDSLYGKTSDLIDRHALHCYNLEFIHPITKEKINIKIDLPIDMNIKNFT